MRKKGKKGKELPVPSGKKELRASLGDFQSAVDKSLKKLRDDKIIDRIWSLDHTIWKEDPSEISNRLGWLHSPEKMMEFILEITGFVKEVRGDGLTHALLLGMGGSSLAPEMFRHIFEVKEGYLDLSILDSTDPGAVLNQARRIDPAKTLFIVSTKSGGTVETISFMKYFYNQILEAIGKDKAGRHFIAITDPGSGLEKMAKELRFRKIFLNDPNIGGRYSALSYFGLVPAGLIGMDIATLLDRACTMACHCGGCSCPVAGDNSAAWLGSIMGELAKAGRDKLTLILSPSVFPFGSWLEQLLAESTGKEGRGILPVNGEEILSPGLYGQDRLFIYLKLEEDSTYDKKIIELEDSGQPVAHLVMRDQYDIGGEIFRWEMATAVAGFFLRINPFDQPNVESAKILARKMVSAYQKEGKLPEAEPTLKDNGLEVYATFPADDLKEVIEIFFGMAQEGEKKGKGRSYIGIQAYLEPTSHLDDVFKELRTDIHMKYKMATSFGYGPRFLHSTGQLHKGDGGHGLFIQFTADMPEDAPIPDKAGEPSSSISFGILKTAQASGDRQALLDVGRHVIRFHLGKDQYDSLKKLSDILKG